MHRGSDTPAPEEPKDDQTLDEDHPGSDPNARSSDGPELPLADEQGDEDPPPELEVESDVEDAETVDYGLEEEEEWWYADVRAFHSNQQQWNRSEEEMVEDLKAFMEHCIEQDTIEGSDALGTEMPCDYEQLSSKHTASFLAGDLSSEYTVSFLTDDVKQTDDEKGYVELQLTPEMTHLYEPAEGDCVRTKLA